MQLNFKTASPFVNVHANNIDALIPELWAQESLAILEENMIAANLVHRDFEPTLAKFGDTVHTRRPGEFVANRKTTTDDVTVQDATSTDVQVPLNQHVHVSFLIRDGEESLAFQDLVTTYMAPAMLAQARFIDQVVLGQYPQFLTNRYGTLLGLQSTNVKAAILGVRNLMNVNKAHPEGRNLIWCPNSETVALSLAEFTQVQNVDDGGVALREAYLGRKFQFQNYMCQNMADVSIGSTTSTGAINNASGYAKGSTVLTVDGITGIIMTNTWLKIAGDDQPLRVTAHTETLGNTTSITVDKGLSAAVVDNAVITFYTPGAINFASGYASGWSKPLVVDGFTVAPKVGQFVTIGTTNTSVVYTVIGNPTTTSIMLDRPLEAAVSDNDTVNIGPAGSYNLAFHRNAMTLVVRPLAQPRAGVGALSAVVNHNGLSMRATITYDGTKQGHLVTLDMLCGVKVLDTNLGAVLIG
jgi:hypothetical protein